MTAQMTDRAVAGLIKRGEPKIYSDRSTKGLVVRVYSSTRATWFYSYTSAVDGKLKRYRIAEAGGDFTITDARAEAGKLTAAIERASKEGRPYCPVLDAQGAARSATDRIKTLGEVVEDYIATKLPEPSAELEQAARYKRERVRQTRLHILSTFIGKRDGLDDWSDLPITDMMNRDRPRGQLLERRDAIHQLVGLTTANQAHAEFSIFLNWCVEREFLAANPLAGVKRLRGQKSRDRVLTDDEIQRIWIATEREGGDFSSMVRLMLLTGARKSELAGLRREDLGRDGLIIADAKTEAGNRIIPLSDAAFEIIDALPRNPATYIFGGHSNGEKVFTSWTDHKRRLDAASGVTDWRIHDLRRTVSTRLHAAGVDPVVIDHLLGHAQSGIRSVYNRYAYAAEKKGAVDRLAAIILGIVHGEPQKFVALRRG